MQGVPGVLSVGEQPGNPCAERNARALGARGFRVCEAPLSRRGNGLSTGGPGVPVRRVQPHLRGAADGPDRSGPGRAAGHPRGPAAVVDIARRAFSQSRFHMDPRISPGRANAIKAAWVDNYFADRRGVTMLVAEDNARVAGFCLFLIDGPALVVDLIAVDPELRGRGHAGRLMAQAGALYPSGRVLRAGTQAVNTASAHLYSGQGFRLARSFNVFHFHG